MEATVEQKVAQAVLQQPEDIKVGDKIYKFYPPSTATLILASEAISQLPQLKLDEKKLAEECLYAAKDCRKVGEIVAIFLLGAKHLTETVKAPQTKEKRLFWGLLRFKETVEVETVIDRKAELTRQLLEDLTPRQLHTLSAQLLQRMQLADFFALTTFLIEINLLRQTKVEETTAFGQ
jgi:hypothetical protein